MYKTKAKLHWGLIILISTLGMAHGVLSLYGMVHGWEYTIWLFLGILSVIVITIKAKGRLFLHGLLMGLGITLLTGLPQSFFLDMYLEANPYYVDQLDPNTNYSQFILMFIPVFGSVYGLLIGSIAWWAKRILLKSPKQELLR